MRSSISAFKSLFCSVNSFTASTKRAVTLSYLTVSYPSREDSVTNSGATFLTSLALKPIRSYSFCSLVLNPISTALSFQL